MDKTTFLLELDKGNIQKYIIEIIHDLKINIKESKDYLQASKGYLEKKPLGSQNWLFNIFRNSFHLP